MPSEPARILPYPQKKTLTTSAANFVRLDLAMIGTVKWQQVIPPTINGPNGFLQSLYEKGLAYEAEMLVNFCPALGTVLANEEVENGRSKEGGHPIERRPLRQWILKITAYADRLIQDFDLVDWPESLKNCKLIGLGEAKGPMSILLRKRQVKRSPYLQHVPIHFWGHLHGVGS